jgi:hypothetical protein
MNEHSVSSTRAGLGCGNTNSQRIGPVDRRIFVERSHDDRVDPRKEVRLENDEVLAAATRAEA